MDSSYELWGVFGGIATTLTAMIVIYLKTKKGLVQTQIDHVKCHEEIAQTLNSNRKTGNAIKKELKILNSRDEKIIDELHDVEVKLINKIHKVEKNVTKIEASLNGKRPVKSK